MNNRTVFILINILLCFITNKSHGNNPKYANWQHPAYFRGFNVLNENPKNQQDFTDLRNSGANFAQLGCFGFNEVTFPYAEIPANENELDSMIFYCRNAGLHYAIAVRQGPGRRDVYLESNYLAPASTIWSNTNEQKLYAGMLKKIALRYSGDSLFAGINMIVEPNPLFDSPYSVNPQLLQVALNYNGIHLDAIYSLLIDSIRTADALLPVIAENVAYSNPEYFSMMQPLTDPYVVYDFHCYAPQQFSGDSIPFTQTYPGNYFSLSTYSIQLYNKSFLESTTLQHIVEFQQLTSAPILMGEFGLKNPQTGGENYLSDLADLAICHGWHFALWDYRRASSQWNYEQMGNSYWATVQQFFVADCSETGVTEISDKSTIKIFPNPSNGNFSIAVNNSDKPLLMEVCNLSGSLLFKTEISDLQTALDLSYLAPGIYFYSIKNKTGKIGNGKLVIR